MWGVGGLPRRTKFGAIVFNFTELLLWDMASMGEAAWNPVMIAVDLCSMPPRLLAPPQHHPMFPLAQPGLLLPKPLTSIFRRLLNRYSGPPPPLQHLSLSTGPQRKPPSVALGAPPSTRVEGPLRLEGADSAIPEPIATSSQVLQCAVMPDNIHISVPTSPCHHHLLCWKVWLWPMLPPLHSLRLTLGLT